MRWFEAEPERLSRELEAMAEVAPELEWNADLTRPGWLDGGGWYGLAPRWPFDRPAPPELDAFLGGQRLEIAVICRQSHPAVEPIVYPLDPEPGLEYRTQHAWHVSGDGSLCLTQRAYDWTGDEMTAELVVKAAGWLVEYLLVSRGVRDDMTEVGIGVRGDLDHLITIPTLDPQESRSGPQA